MLKISINKNYLLDATCVRERVYKAVVPNLFYSMPSL